MSLTAEGGTNVCNVLGLPERDGFFFFCCREHLNSMRTFAIRHSQFTVVATAFETADLLFLKLFIMRAFILNFVCVQVKHQIHIVLVVDTTKIHRQNFTSQ